MLSALDLEGKHVTGVICQKVNLTQARMCSIAPGCFFDGPADAV
jgi:hypothetical protein